MLTAHVVAIFTRLLTASFALISLKLTYEVLSPEDFSLLNYLLFIIAVSIALSSPINRIFWAENSYDKFIDSIYCVSAITVIVSAILIIIYGMINDTHWHAIASIWFLSCLYSVYKIVERYIYGQTFFDRSLTQALMIPAFFAFTELAFVTYQYLSEWSSLHARLSGPVALAGFILIFSSTLRKHLTSLMVNLRYFGKSMSLITTHVFSSSGGKMLIFSVATTAAVMIDRLIIGYLPVKDASRSADYLLALSYAIAIQTLLNLIVDLSRKHMYQNKAWMPGAKRFADTVFKALLPAILALILVFPVLQYIKIIPPSVTIYVWSVLILRTIGNFVITFCYTDSIQSGRISDSFLPVFMMIIIGIIFICSILMGLNEIVSAAICGALILLLSLIVTVKFYRRVPAV